MATGIPRKDWMRLSKNPDIILPESLGGATSKKEAGKAIGRAKEKAGIFDKLVPQKEGLARSMMEKLSEGKSSEFLSKEN
jgi:hypothetical protein